MLLAALAMCPRQQDADCQLSGVDWVLRLCLASVFLLGMPQQRLGAATSFPGPGTSQIYWINVGEVYVCNYKHSDIYKDPVFHLRNKHNLAGRLRLIQNMNTACLVSGGNTILLGLFLISKVSRISLKHCNSGNISGLAVVTSWVTALLALALLIQFQG